MAALLSPNQLAIRANSTPLGKVISERQMMAFRTVAGVRIGDGKGISPVHFLAWIVRQAYPKNSRSLQASVSVADPERIPESEEAYREWFGSRYEGPKARALQIMDLEARMQNETGIAYVQLRKLHDETLQRLAPITANVERLFVAVYDEARDDFVLEEEQVN